MSHHLDDGALAEIWTAAVSTGQPAADPHLASCAECQSRYTAFTAWLDGLRDDARAEADKAFPPERLAAQHAQVLRRLEALEKPARVIAFPRFGRPVTSTQGHAQRWVAGAAAAGLVIGLAAGQFLDFRHKFASTVPQPQNTTVRFTTPQQPGGPMAAIPREPLVSDETIFYGGDTAQSVVRVSTLQSMDDITPRARDLDRPR